LEHRDQPRQDQQHLRLALLGPLDSREPNAGNAPRLCVVFVDLGQRHRGSGQVLEGVLAFAVGSFQARPTGSHRFSGAWHHLADSQKRQEPRIGPSERTHFEERRACLDAPDLEVRTGQ
jgi:hypothetical protein